MSKVGETILGGAQLRASLSNENFKLEGAQVRGAQVEVSPRLRGAQDWEGPDVGEPTIGSELEGFDEPKI